MVELLNFSRFNTTLRNYLRIFVYLKVRIIKYFYICGGKKQNNQQKINMDIGLKTVKINAVFSYNKADNIYTVSMLGKGGPIVTSNTLEEAKSKFERALDLSVAVNNLLFFKRFKKENQVRDMGYLGSTNEITYTQLQVA